MSVIRQISLIDPDTGEFISTNTEVLGNKLKGGWIVIYKEALVKLLTECPNYATLKVYLRIAAAQDFDTVTYISTPFVAQAVGITYQTAWSAVKWLIEHDYLRKVTNQTGGKGFVVNPTVTTCGKKNFEAKLEHFQAALGAAMENADQEGNLPDPAEFLPDLPKAHGK